MSLEQDLVAGVEEHQLRVQPHRADFRQPFGQAGQVVVAVAHVDADRELARRVVAAGDAAHEAAQQLGRQVVDAVEPEVLEGLQRHRLAAARQPADDQQDRSEEHTSELQSLMRISYAVFCLKKKKKKQTTNKELS